MKYNKTRKQKKKGGQQEFESMRSYLDRMFLFWYSRVDPDKANAFLQSKGSRLKFITPDPSQKKMTPQQKEILLSLVNLIFVDNQDGHEEEFAKALLNISADEFNKEYRTYEAVGQPIFDPYKQKLVTAESFAKSMARLPNLLRKSDRNLDYYQDWAENLCAVNHDIVNTPFTTFQSDFCIPVLNKSKEAANKVAMHFPPLKNSKKQGMPATYPYLIVKDEFLPMLTERRSAYTFIKARKFLTTSWVHDAFDKEAVLDIQYSLAEIMKKEAFDFWNKSLWFTVYKLNDIENIRFEDEKFILTDNHVFPSKNIYANLHFFVKNSTNAKNKKINLLKNIFSSKQIYGFDMITSLYLRKYLPKEWINLTNDPNMDKVNALDFTLQLFVTKLQYMAYLKIAFGEFCGPMQNNAITNNTMNTPLRKEVLVDALKVYSWDLSNPDVQTSIIKYLDNDEQRKIIKETLFIHF